MKHTRLALFILALVAIVVTFALCNQSVKEVAGQEISFPQSIGGGELMPLALGKPNVVRVNGNWRDAGDLPTGAGSFASGNEDFREFLMVAHGSRIRQTGDIRKLIMAWSSTKPDTIIVKFWRWIVGSKYALVGATQNLSADLATGDTTTVIVDPPVAVAIGDYYSLHIANGAAAIDRGLAESFFDNGASPGPPGNEAPPDPASGNHKYGMFFVESDNAAFPSGNYHWGDQGEGAFSWLEGEYIPIEFYMKAPQVVMLGASIMTGHNEHRSFWENRSNDSTGAEGSTAFILNDSTSTAMDSMPAFYINGSQVLDVSTAFPYSLLRPVADATVGYLANYTGWSFQNMGKSSDTAATLLTTFPQRCGELHPRLAFIGVGSADVNNGITPDAHATTMSVLMDSLDSHNIIGVFRGIVPRTVWNPGDAVAVEIAKNDTVDVYNKIVADVVRNHPTTSANGTQMFYVPVYHKLGKDNPNSWPNTIRNDYHDLITAYANTDTIHLNSFGAKRMSEELTKALRRP